MGSVGDTPRLSKSYLITFFEGSVKSDKIKRSGLNIRIIYSGESDLIFPMVVLPRTNPVDFFTRKVGKESIDYSQEVPELSELSQRICEEWEEVSITALRDSDVRDTIKKQPNLSLVASSMVHVEVDIGSHIGEGSGLGSYRSLPL